MPDLGLVIELSIRLAVAAGLGAIVGLERELHNHPAGMRTHILVSLGSALFAVVFSFGLTYIIGSIIKAVGGLRLSEQVEVGGIDLAVHGESAYDTIGARISSEVE